MVQNWYSLNVFNLYRAKQFELYNKARSKIIKDPLILIELEKFFTSYVFNVLQDNIKSFSEDYDEASKLYPFWQNYPPDERGRKPRGDQYPWIEVGEHAIGSKLGRFLAKEFKLRDVGIPTGPDQRFLLRGPKIKEITKGLTDSAWLMIDIKSVGPRDDFDHTVMSHNQISGEGVWLKPELGIQNSIFYASGAFVKHKFYPTLPPLYVLSDLTVAPTITIALKPVYKMLSLLKDSKDGGQPLSKIVVAAIPNGLLLKENPGYLKKHPRLLFPGKDDKTKNVLKVRCRVSFSILNEIADWRVTKLDIESPLLSESLQPVAS